MRLQKLLTAAVLCAALTVPSAALTLEVDGVDRTGETKAVLLEGRTYVSLRSALTLLCPDAQVGWEDGAAVAAGGGLELSARPGERQMWVNGGQIHTGGEILNLGGTVMLPLRALCEAVGGHVSWEGETSTARVSFGEDREPGEQGYSGEDLYWLSRIISAESRGEPLKGKIAVGTVVLNRVASREFPDTIYDVIFDGRWGGQFEPVRNGTVYNEPTQESVQAARMCLEGAREAGDSLYFLAPDLTSNHWTMHNRTYVTTIGCHWFYK